MFKLIGMIVGAGLIILAGIAWLDAPKAKKVSSQLHSKLDQAIDQVAEQEIITPQAVKEKLPEVVPDPGEQIIITETAESLPHEISTDEPDPEGAKQPVVADSAWHIFWKPFRSISSAEGFAQRLSQQTGIKISVISDDQGKHRVTFPYIDEANKQHILQLIHEKTGLEVI